ncbi:cupin domain-containing protein [Brachybacterium hainanense]|uniref:Cupin domain-containing protein n=1 Tax=Brachybacterium hainanense TaxID=1541174 RepID=A0ABV6R6W3_9MICO
MDSARDLREQPSSEPLPVLPGGTSSTRLRVYPWEAPDGLRGGTPHVHLASTEAYTVLAGSGRVLTLTATQGTRWHELTPGTQLWFTPGTVHRLVNDSGDLEILALMANRGLPESGDAVMTFPPEHLSSPEAYAAAAALPAPGTADPTAREAAVRARRDLALDGLVRIQEDPEAFDRFLEAALALVHHRAEDWTRIAEAGPAADAARTREALAALAEGSTRVLRAARIGRSTPQEALGMCGHLQQWPPA